MQEDALSLGSGAKACGDVCVLHQNRPGGGRWWGRLRGGVRTAVDACVELQGKVYKVQHGEGKTQNDEEGPPEQR